MPSEGQQKTLRNEWDVIWMSGVVDSGRDDLSSVVLEAVMWWLGNTGVSEGGETTYTQPSTAASNG
jgi:hypothetical protein